MKQLLVLILSISFAVGVFAQGKTVRNYDNLKDVPTVKAKLIPVFYPMCKQASFVCQNHLVCLKNDGHAIAYDWNAPHDSAFFDLNCAPQKPHCNVAQLLAKGTKNYLYVSEWDGQRRFFVEEINYNKKSNTWSSKLIQTISTDISDSIIGEGCADWVVDAKNHKLYLHTYKNGGKGSNSAKIGTNVSLLEFNLPSRQVENVVLHENDILRQVMLPMFYVTQDKEIHNGKLYVLAGLRTVGKNSWDFSRRIFIVDLKSMKVEKMIDLSEYYDEPEGIDFYKGQLYITLRRGIYKLKINDTNQ